MATETITFEGIAPKGSTDLYEVPDGTGGLHWSNFGVADKAALKGAGSGYSNDLHGRALAVSAFGTQLDPTISVASGTFDFVGGHFASGDQKQMTLTFYAYTGTDFQLSATKQVVIDRSDEQVKLGADFKNITGVVIESSYDGQTASFAMDNLQFRLRGQISAGDPAAQRPLPPSGHDHVGAPWASSQLQSTAVGLHGAHDLGLSLASHLAAGHLPIA